MPRVVLRYFDCRGRAEPLRHLLRDRGIAFEDVREPIDASFISRELGLSLDGRALARVVAAR